MFIEQLTKEELIHILDGDQYIFRSAVKGATNGCEKCKEILKRVWNKEIEGSK